MIAWKRITAGAALLTLAAITACEDYSIALGPEPTLTGVHMTVKTSETWGTRKLMIVGEEGRVTVTCYWSDEIGHPCEPSQSYSSSAPTILSIHGAGPVATLRAHAPGTAVITARVGNFTRDTTILVVSEPLPIDDLWVDLTNEDYWCPTCQASYNPRLELERVLMPVGGSLAFEVGARREGMRVFGLESELASTDDGVVYPSKRCRPTDLDPDCDEYSPHWVSALSLGTATVSVTARNLTVTFEVEVADSL